MKIKKDVWIIVDKKRKVVACGVPRNRQLKFIDDSKNTSRILTYASEKKAVSGFRDSGFYNFDTGNYMEDNYGTFWQRTEGRGTKDYPLEAVRCKFTLEF